MSINPKNQPENTSFVKVDIPSPEIKIQFVNVIDDDSKEDYEDAELPL